MPMQSHPPEGMQAGRPTIQRPPPRPEGITITIRLSLALGLLGLLVVPSVKRETDLWLEGVYQALRNHWAFKHDTFEPMLVVVAFAAFLLLFLVLDQLALQHSWLAACKVFPAHVTDMKPWAFEGFARLRQETFWYVAPLALFDYLYPRRHLTPSAPGMWQLIFEVTACLAVYDTLFFVCHITCHRQPWLFKHVHSKHHRFLHTRASETIVLTLWEEALDVTCSVIAVNLVGAHPLSRAAYNLVIVYLLTELHSGFDFPWSLENVVPLGLWAGPRRHALHHLHGNCCYAKFMPMLDAACGTHR